MTQIETHPLAQLFPALEGEALHDLMADIKANGLREAIWLHKDGRILDGRNRYTACVNLAIKPSFRTYEKDDDLAFVLSQNLARRHLNESQRAMVAARLATMKRGDNQHTEISATSQSAAATTLSVSPDSVQFARKVQQEAAPEVAGLVDRGKMAVSMAAKLTESPRGFQEKVVEYVELGMNPREALATVKKEANAALPKLEAPEGQYDVIVVDPPWPMQKIEREVAPNQVAFDYPVMELEDICGLELPAADNCHLFCWTTQKFLPVAFNIIHGWGFQYVFCMTWKKNGGFQPFGLPQYNSEFCLYGRRGTPKFVDTKNFNTCFEANRRAHSQKPDEFYDAVKRVTEGKRIDMFSREKREGFEQYGNQCGMFTG